jgi:hypothetical protein
MPNRVWSRYCFTSSCAEFVCAWSACFSLGLKTAGDEVGLALGLQPHGGSCRRLRKARCAQAG